tara:strand:- start:382 stop:651 length:270 start_codon:yes stop_codon:yes gene_type:complete
MVVRKALGFSERQKTLVQNLFERNATFFSENNFHHSKHIAKLFDSYNKHFAKLVGATFTKFEYDCEDCKNHIIKFWSFIIYDIWQKEIV